MKTIFRNFLTTLRRFKMASTLNILGLSVAFAAFILILMQVRYEYSFDRFHKNADRIYRVETTTADIGTVPIVSLPFGPTFGNSVAAVESYCMLTPTIGNSYVTLERNGTQTGFMEDVFYASKGFIEVFTPELLEGTDQVLAEPDKVLLPASLARKFFGVEVGVLGRRVSLTRGDGTHDYQVGGVYRDFPENSQIKNCVYASKSEREWQAEDWGTFNNYMYVLLRPGADVSSILAEWNRFDLASKVQWGEKPSVGMTLLSDIYFDTRLLKADIFTEHGQRTTADLLLAVALLVIGIAAINFVNFATSLVPLRIKSINTQKVLGSPVSTLRWGLIFEAVGIAVLAFVLALLWVLMLGETSFSQLLSGGVSFANNRVVLFLAAGVAVAVGFLAGLYPAFYSTSFPPALVLKRGSFGMSPSGKRLRTILIGFQFVVSIGLIVASLFLQLQNSYLRHLDTGLDREQVAYAELHGNLVGSKAFEAELKRSPLIEDVAYSDMLINVGNAHAQWFKTIRGQEVSFMVDQVSWNFPQMMGVGLVDGAYFSQNDVQNQGNTYLFNERAAREYGIGLQDRIVECGEGDDAVKSRICGISKDFNFQSLHSAIEPYAMVVQGTAFGQTALTVAYFKIKGDPYAALDHIRKAAAAVDPAYPMDVRFMDQAFDDLYRKELRTTSLITVFSLLAVLISLVGVFGLVVFETQYRRKEIGIRKVMGATVLEILTMFNRSFFRLVLICFVVAAPLAWYGVTRWLETFAYRTPIYWWVFAVALVIVMGITLVTVTVQSWRAATANPVGAIKSE
ncbi:ABC transporter permease [Millionella massiliensis]|uniref:ABC transporter permease n=1 Tax=Millionella massiliensis TaxID=1871023 RepID=UPI0008DA4DCA|nr:ABC transporter permease [Millionella massiliensis]